MDMHELFLRTVPAVRGYLNPIGISSVPQATNVLYDLYDKVDEFEILIFHSNPTNKINPIKGKEIRSIDDLKGMTFHASAGTASNLLIQWNATPIQMTPGDIYQAAEKGTVGGFIFDWPGIVSFGLQKVTANYTAMPVYLGPYFLAMNKESMSALPEDLQQLIRKHSGRDASLGMNIGLSMLLVGFVGYGVSVNWKAAFGVLQTVPYVQAASYTMTVVPLFIMIGNFAFASGMSENLYAAANKWLGRLPGGLACATVAA